MLTQQMLHRLWPHIDEAKPGLTQAIVDSHEHVFQKYGLTTPLVVAHAMAQFSHEFGAGNPASRMEFEENLKYSAKRMTEVWPSRFPNIMAAAPYANDPKKLANKVYNGRMGNRPNSDDGYNFRGRGAAQTTGREGYQRLAAKTGLDVVNNPDLVLEPSHFLECAVADFVLCGCLPFAQRDDLRGVTHHLNGGYIGLTERGVWLTRWKAALKDVELGSKEPTAQMEVPKPQDGAIRYGDSGWQVKALQDRLNELGYSVGSVDGKFGASTRAALLAFQANEGLTTDGIAGPATQQHLTTAPHKPIEEERANATEADLAVKGSEIVAQTQNIDLVGKATVGASAVGVAEKAGLWDKVREYTEQVGGFHEAFDILQTVGTWMAEHWWVFAGIAGAGVWYFGRKVIAKRLEDHRTGANMSK